MGIEIYEIGFTSNQSQSEYYDIFLQYGYNTLDILDNVIGSHEYAEGPVTHMLGGNTYSGLYISDTDFATIITIQDNDVSGNGDTGMEIEYVGQDLDTLFDDPDTYPLYTGPEILVDGNTITENDSYGFYQYDDWEYGTDVTISNNWIADNGDTGIYHDYDVNQASVLISGNTIVDNEGAGIYHTEYIENGASYTVQDNYIAGNSEEGVYLYEIDDVGTVVTIVGNVIGAWDTYGGNGDEGVYLEDVNDAFVEIDDNDISQNGADGVYLYYVGGEDTVVNLTYNTIAMNGVTGDNGDNGVYVYDTAGYDEVRIGPGNAIYQNPGAGVYVDYEAYDVRIVGNDITENGHGVWNEGMDTRIGHSNIMNNTSSGSGIHVHEDASGTIVRGNNIVGNTAIGSYGLFNEDEEDVVDARGNYWGDPHRSAPRDAQPRRPRREHYLLHRIRRLADLHGARPRHDDPDRPWRCLRA